LFETITEPCKHCSGTGYIRSVEILAVGILRSIRHACADKQVGVIYVYTSHEVISYIANYKKRDIIAAEQNYNVHIFMHHSDDVGNGGFTIKKRKGLSDDERRELEMEVTTGKVNQLGLERLFIESDSAEKPMIEEASEDRSSRDRDDRRDNRDNRGGDRGGDNRGGDRRNNNRNNNNQRFNNRRPRGNDNRRFDDRGDRGGSQNKSGSSSSILGSFMKIFK
jgi:ribonuclease E